MALSSTTSVSKGCFLFNPQAKPSTKVLQAQFSQLPGETNRNARQRNKVFNYCWSELEEKIEQVVSEQHRGVVSKLLRFAGDAHKQLQNLHSRAIAYRQREKKRKTTSFFPSKFEIPAAALIAGVNMPDHSQLFSELRDELHSSVSPHVVLLKSKDCSSGMKELMSGIRRQLLQTEIADQSSSDDDGDKMKKVKRASLRGLPLCSVSVLNSWYQEQHHAGEGSRVPVVLVVEDFESFPPSILQDLITSLSPHLPDFPVVLILGLATTVNTVHRLLPQSVSSLLALEQIHAQPATNTFTTILKEIFLSSSVSFKLGPNCFKFLLHHFFYTNFSVKNVTRHIQFSVMEHFFWQPLSILCHQQYKERKELLDKLTHPQCEMIRSLLSYRRYVEGLEPKEQILLLEDDKALKENSFKLLGDLDTYHQVYYPLLECFHCFSCRLPEAPFGKSLHELYSLALESNPTAHAKFASAWMYLRVLGKEELSKNLKQCIEILTKVVNSESSPAVLVTAASALSELYTELEQLGQNTAEKSTENESTPPKSDETTLQQRLRFQERLRKLASQNKALSGYEALRTRILEQVMDLFKKHLDPPSCIPLHEIFYFDQHKSLKKHLAAAPRVAIQTALNQPNHYLTSADVVSTNDSIPAKIPDLCIAYQLHTECGTMINLYDWMQSYSSIVSPSKPKLKVQKKQLSAAQRLRNKDANEDLESSEEVIQARFIQSVSEMQFLGFIKPTHRKTDHVQRLTWGAC